MPVLSCDDKDVLFLMLASSYQDGPNNFVDRSLVLMNGSLTPSQVNVAPESAIIDGIFPFRTSCFIFFSFFFLSFALFCVLFTI